MKMQHDHKATKNRSGDLVLVVDATNVAMVMGGDVVMAMVVMTPRDGSVMELTWQASSAASHRLDGGQ